MPLVLGGCAKVNDVAMRAMATSSAALAVVGDTVLSGRTVLYTDRSGTLDLQASGDQRLTCMGTMRYTTSTSGAVNLRCSDGTQTQLGFTALTETTGHGSGRIPGGIASFTYGLDADAARAWLTAPAGKRLVVSGDSLQLE